MFSGLLLGLLTLRVLTWSDFTPDLQHLAGEIGITAEKLPGVVAEIRERNQRRLLEGERDHLVNYVLHSNDFTKADPILAGQAALDAKSTALVQRRVRDFVKASEGGQPGYLASLLPSEGRVEFLNSEVQRVLRWTQEKELGCPSMPDPHRCVADLYQKRGHSSDTSAASNLVIGAGLGRVGKHEIRRVLIIGPGVDLAGRTGGSSERTFQPQFVRGLLTKGAIVDCVDLNPRVTRTVAGVCDSEANLDIAVERIDKQYDLIIATNVLLYLNQQELLLALANISAMLADRGVFLHNDARFETNVFGRAADMPVAHFGTVTLDGTRRPISTDRFVIHSRSGPRTGSTAPP